MANRKRESLPASPRPSSRPAGLSLARMLPLLTTIVVAAALVTALEATSIALTSSALRNAEDRVQRSVNQLALLVEAGIRRSIARYNAAATDSAVHRALAAAATGDVPAPDVEAARAALARLVTPNDSGMPAELWSADGRRIAHVGNDIHITPRSAAQLERQGDSGAGATARAIPAREGLDSVTATDSLQFGSLYTSQGRVYLWVVKPVLDGKRPLGFITQQRIIAANPQTDETVRVLGGTSLGVYYRNVDGGFWTTIGGIPVQPPQEDLTNPAGHRFRPMHGEVVYGEARAHGTPLVVVMEMARNHILAEPQALVRRLAILSALLTILAAAISWAIGKRLTRPLVHLTQAAESVASGDYAARVPTTGADEVARLAASFNHMTEQVGSTLAALESANRAKSDFLATMSHELRTPLNAIGGYVELLEMGLRGPLTDAQRRDLGRIRSSQAHLLSLISAVLDLSRFETGRVSYDLSAIPIDPFLAGLDALIAPQAASKRLTMHYEQCPPQLAVTADREKLRQVLLNLLSNAIRYTPAGGTVTLGAETLPNDKVAIRVRDTGPGIASDRQEEIFEPFVQLDRTLTQSREGVGLGLSISRDLARGMGGELSVESRVGEGSSFVVTLPATTMEGTMALTGTGETQASTFRVSDALGTT